MALAVPRRGAGALQPVRVIAYNILVGGQQTAYDADRGPTRRQRIVQYLATQRPDVVLFTELKNFSRADFATWVRDGLGHASAVLGVTSGGYHVGVSSRFPLSELEFQNDAFHHGALAVRVDVPVAEATADATADATAAATADATDAPTAPWTAPASGAAPEAAVPPTPPASLSSRARPFHVLVTHLTPYDSVKRVDEMAAVAAMVARHPSPAGWLVAGDLNTLSPHDAPQYAACAARLAALRKFARPPAAAASAVAPALDYAPLQVLLDAGWIDLGAASDVPFAHTAPTCLEVDSAHCARLRLDYMLVDAALAHAAPAGAVPPPAGAAGRPVYRVLQNDVTDYLSDHYPIACELFV
ncbi:hypothetical protein CXG81DRAFT_28281 [Caulochytrium protostelioides]|uniref:Endonuclease/exonuclease/phosphatase domain-containing protein n=1 Tax=Caulochytrium protostelioides TaxID=1555241 RepID=A0A4P9X2M4_9FUNG|nr:hypothetical protein CXG81DRAFT_28281 [Caulochytrium protostelioides]|eukprot:RKO98930.1 hypothetical protein CXG81DRAFT_28281 [Caulochytrium protostelioides]